jgi:hypothetical protein
MSNFEFTKRLFIHHFLNPPAIGRASNLNLNLVNSDAALMLTNIQSDGPTHISLEVKRPLEIGFTRSEQYILEFEISNLTLAFNFNLGNICMTDAYIEYSPAEVKLKPSESKSTSKRQDDTIMQIVTDRIAITEKANVAIGTEENVDEQNVVRIFEKIQKMNRQHLQSTSPISQLNLDHALREFEEGMSPLNTISKFKHIYNAVEFATNLNGEKRQSSDLDAAVCNLAGTWLQQDLAEEWRCFYNRLKHPDRDGTDASRYTEGEKNLPSWLPQIRTCAVKILSKHLDNL